MGAGASKSSTRRKVQALAAFDEAGRRHREKKGHGGSRKGLRKRLSRVEEVTEDEPSMERTSSVSSNWVRLRERSLPSIELQPKTTLRLSDFNKVVRQKTLDPDDEKPIDIPYGMREKVRPEELCHICSVYTGRETYPCRICCKVYHEGCLHKLGYCKDPASCLLLKRALKPKGWSCHECDDCSNMLTEEELFALLDSFEKYDLTQDSSISLEEYLTYRKRAYKDTHTVSLPKAELQDEMAQFHRLDKENSGSVTWWEFLNYESIKILLRRGKNAITRLLYPREIELAYRLFHNFDDANSGEIREYDAKKALASWYTLFLENDDTLNGFTIMSSNKEGELWYIVAEMLTFTMDTSVESSRKVNWNEFLRELSIYIIAARPNLSPVPMESSEWTKDVVVSTETDCDIKRTSL
ncbi:PHD finger protein 24-like [Ylistrum balloti]|uniref:PHD finger protein 24-like n=1 Tax=Ylistrum balloti TaxID=509963 RepID=UPI002905AB22|nr:PHD finger protein 24-like [Ylistrum balloti]